MATGNQLYFVSLYFSRVMNIFFFFNHILQLFHYSLLGVFLDITSNLQSKLVPNQFSLLDWEQT